MRASGAEGMLAERPAARLRNERPANHSAKAVFH
jgi:hypothetical protein